jgi:hypothetical protein
MHAGQRPISNEGAISQMWKKIAVAAGIGAAVAGGTTAALAAASDNSAPSPSTSPSANSSPTNGAKNHRDGLAHRFLRRFEHGEWVTKGQSGTETHDAIRGTVSSASPAAVSVKADDGFTLSFTVDKDTKVVLRENGKGSAKHGTISDVEIGDHVLVAGVKSGSTLTARHVLDTGTK